MSRTELPLPNENRDEQDSGPSARDRLVEGSSRIGISRDAAKAEMERFRGVAEYETRKLFGQHSALWQPMEPLQGANKSRRRSSRTHSTNAEKNRSQSRDQSGNASGSVSQRTAIHEDQH